jgi:cytochrome c oxidase subunit 1
LFMVFGVFALLAVLSGVLFILVAVGSLLFGDKVEPGDNEDLLPAGGLHADGGKPVHAYEMRGTFVITLIFMAVFVVSYVFNWYLVTELWSIGL